MGVCVTMKVAAVAVLLSAAAATPAAPCGTISQVGGSCGGGPLPDPCMARSCAEGLVCYRPKGLFDAPGVCRVPDQKGYFHVKRDVRRCAFPLCGGYWVSLVNSNTTMCADGTQKEECYVAEIASKQTFTMDFNMRLITGVLSTRAWENWGVLGQFALGTDHDQASTAVGTGSFVSVRDNGVRCITHPCPSLTQHILNTEESSTLSGVSFDKSLDAAMVEWANEKIFTQQAVVVAGTYETTTGPAGEGMVLVVNQIYRPVAAATPAPPCGTISQVGGSCGGGPLPDPCMARSCAEGLVCYRPKGLFDAPGVCRVPDQKGYFHVKRDVRRCAFPLCGGYWVSLVNSNTTMCADGTQKERCYVAEIASKQTFTMDFNMRLITGVLSTRAWENWGVLGQFALGTDHDQASTAVGTGSFVSVRGNGVRCITHPCPSLTQHILNTEESSSLSGVSFDKSLDAAMVEWANEKIFTQQAVVVAGTYETTTGPAGEGTVLVVNQIYRPVAAATPAPPCGTISQVGGSCGGGPLPDPCMARSCAEGLVCYRPEGLFDAPGVCRVPDQKGYFHVKRDVRRCAFPLCGGYWVSLVNKKLTMCADGTQKERCYVAEIASKQTFTMDFNMRLITGVLSTRAWENWGVLGQFALGTDHDQASTAVGTGSFVSVRDNGVRCITHPCPSLTQHILNTEESSSLSGASFDKSLDDAMVEWANEKIFTQQAVVVAGTYETTTGPAGEGTVLVVNQIYRPAAAETPKPLVCWKCPAGQRECTFLQRLFGVCALPDSSCIALHSVWCTEA